MPESKEKNSNKQSFFFKKKYISVLLCTLYFLSKDIKIRR